MHRVILAAHNEPPSLVPDLVEAGSYAGDATLVAAEVHVREFPLQRGKRYSEGSRGEAFVARTCFEGQHDLLPAQFMKGKDPLGIRSPFTL